MGKLDGKVAIITGASRGIGKDMALVFGKEGAKVVVTARTMNEGDFRIPGSVNTTVERIKAEGGDAIGLHCDVSSEEEIDEAIKATVSHYGRVDIMVNNAAILIPGSIQEMQVKHWDLLFKVNIRGPFLSCKAVLPQMIDQGWGHIINISSTGSFGPGPGPYTGENMGGTSYGAGKAHLERFSQGLAQEVYEHNVAVNVLSPTLGIASEGQRWFSPPDRDYSGSREDGVIMGDAAAVICSREPKDYTGHILFDEAVLREAGVRDLSKYTIM